MSTKGQQAVHLGTSGWAYVTWKPGFYPAKLPQKKFLEYYATQLNSVEVNYTFRQLPSETMLAGWGAAVGGNFKFSFKAPQRITHFARLKNCAEFVQTFYNSLAPVIRLDRMGIALYQLPPNFKSDVPLLDDFLTQSQTESVRVAVEFRHPSWFADEIYHVLKKHSVALCVAESDELNTPDIETAPFRCYRLRKTNYSPEELQKLAEKFHAKAAISDVFAYFKHEDDPTGALRAAAVLKQMSKS